MRAIILLLPFLLTSTCFALAVDEKLPIRILRVSQSKKTLLANRGLEDGLVVGDHAKFFLSVGVVARGVVIKASPTRSVWSIYRLVNSEFVQNDKPMNIKISPAVSLTEDKTKMLSPEDRYDDLDRIKNAQGGEGVAAAEKLDVTDAEDLASLEKGAPQSENIPVEDNLMERSFYSDRTWEVFSMLYLNMLSSTTTNSSGDSSGSITAVDFSLGVEKYFEERNAWYSPFSLYPFLHKVNQDIGNTDINDTVATVKGVDVLELGLGVNYHWNAHPTTTNRLLWFTGLSLALGKATQSYTNGDEFSGSSTSFAIGGGIKYFLSNGLGLRAMLDYYIRSESYDIANAATSLVETQVTKVAGPRIIAGLSYRW